MVFNIFFEIALILASEIQQNYVKFHKTQQVLYDFWVRLYGSVFYFRECRKDGEQILPGSSDSTNTQLESSTKFQKTSTRPESPGSSREKPRIRRSPCAEVVCRVADASAEVVYEDEESAGIFRTEKSNVEVKSVFAQWHRITTNLRVIHNTDNLSLGGFFVLRVLQLK